MTEITKSPNHGRPQGASGHRDLRLTGSLCHCQIQAAVPVPLAPSAANLTSSCALQLLLISASRQGSGSHQELLGYAQPEKAPHETFSTTVGPLWTVAPGRCSSRSAAGAWARSPAPPGPGRRSRCPRPAPWSAASPCPQPAAVRPPAEPTPARRRRMGLMFASRRPARRDSREWRWGRRLGGGVDERTTCCLRSGRGCGEPECQTLP
jgi:hypothetical protein